MTFCNKLFCLFLLLTNSLSLCGANGSDLTEGQRKVDLITSGKMREGTFVTFTAKQLLALGMAEAEKKIPGAIHNPVLQLGGQRAIGTALIDFSKLQAGKPGLMSKFFSGQQEIRAYVETSSGGGKMTIHPIRVEVSGLVVEGYALQFFIKNFLLPYYPDAMVDRPFPLSWDIDRIEVTPSLAKVWRKR